MLFSIIRSCCCFIILFTMGNSVWAQEKEAAIGQVVYAQQVAKKTDSGATGKDYLTREMTLYFGKTASLYQASGGDIVRPKIKFSGAVADSSRLDMNKINDEIRSRMPGNSLKTGTVLLKNYVTGGIMQQQTAFDDNYLISDSIGTINWLIGNETKTIAEKVCQKATCRFRGRNYTAWFTQDIPVGAGPWKLGGLPGLILEASDDRDEVRFNFVSLTIPAPTVVEIDRNNLSGKPVTREAFSKEASRRSENIANMMKASGNKVSAQRVTLVSMEIAGTY